MRIPRRSRGGGIMNPRDVQMRRLKREKAA